MQTFIRLGARTILVGFALALGVLLASLVADTLTIPNKSFSPGGVIRAQDFNDNYTTIEAWANGEVIADDNLKDNGITASEKVIDGSIDLAAMGADSVNSAKIVNDSVQSVDIADGSIQGVDIAATTVALSNMAANSVDTTKIVDDTIKAEDLDSTSAFAQDTFVAYDAVADEFEPVQYLPCTYMMWGYINPADETNYDIMMHNHLAASGFWGDGMPFPTDNHAVTYVYAKCESMGVTPREMGVKRNGVKLQGCAIPGSGTIDCSWGPGTLVGSQGDQYMLYTENGTGSDNHCSVVVCIGMKLDLQ